MSVTYGFFNAQQVNGDYDRKYGADELAEYFASLIGNGISADVTDCFKITPVSGMQISINAGYAWINGYWVKNDSAVIKTLAVAPSANSRKDSIVLRFSKADRSIELFVVQGDASSTPSFKPLTRTSDVYELMIGYITITAGISAITSAMITDTRENTDYCGIISTFSQRVLPDGSITSIKLANDSIITTKIKNKNVTASKLSDECKNIIRENVALSASAFIENSSVDGANYKAEISIAGCTAAMLPIIAWKISQSEELEVQQIESASGKIVIYTANAPGNDITIPTIALISPIGTGSSGMGPGGGGGDGTGTLTAAAIIAALGYTPAKSTDIPTMPTTDIAANTEARHTHSNKGVLDKITGVVTTDKIGKPDHVTDLVQYDAFQIAAQRIISQIPTVPAALPNPNALKIKIGSTTVTYDGSSAQTVEIADGTEVSY